MNPSTVTVGELLEKIERLEHNNQMCSNAASLAAATAKVALERLQRVEEIFDALIPAVDKVRQSRNPGLLGHEIYELIDKYKASRPS